MIQNGSPWWSPWAWGKEKKSPEQDQVNREVVPVRWCSSRPGTAGCWGRCEQVHCGGEAATICPATVTLVTSRALSEAKAAGSLCRLADWSSGPVARTHCGRCLWYRRTSLISMTLTFDFDCLAFFGLGDVGDFHWQLWRLVSGSYSKLIRVSSPVMTLRSKSGSVWRHSMMTWHTCRRRSFSSSFSSLGTIFFADFPHERKCKQKHVKQNSIVAEGEDYSYMLPRYHVRW